ncbi:MAG: FeoA family protein [Candidatus Zipacnadales bacterium]
MPLSALPLGQSAIVVAIEGGQSARRRLASMGLTVGSEVQTLIGRGRGPIVVVVRQTRLALGRGIADRVMVEPLEA